ncbi:MAG: ABC transporter substrate-binding protein, partial [Actinobacteria bacterium]|nr:ABC transporter substrate-binding protein [Actinomycetota bacterium]
MKQKWLLKSLMLLAVFGMIAAACGDSDSASDRSFDETTSIKLQLQWVPQSQFAGYFAAADLGFYEDVGLDVEIIEGGV